MNIDEIKKLFMKNGSVVREYFTDSFLSKNPHIVNSINSHIPRDDLSIKDKIQFIIKNDGDLCKMCKNPLPFYKRKMSFICKLCSKKQSNIKRKTTNLERYGNEVPLRLDEFKEKQRKTNLEKYGVEYPSQNVGVRNKQKHTNVEKYGVEYPSQSTIVKDKRKQTTKERYGVEHYSKTNDWSNNIKNTIKERYGEEYYFMTDDFKSKSKSSMIEKYDVENAMESNHFKSKKMKTVMDRYGVDSFTKTDEWLSKTKNTLLKKYGVEHYSKSKHYIQTRNGMSDELWEEYSNPLKVYEIYQTKCNKNLQELCDYFGVSSSVMGFYFKRNNLEVLHGGGCSFQERLLSEEICKMFTGIEIIRNTRQIIPPKELDIYLPEYKLAIEYCGSYWHSDLFKDQYYHYNKWKECRELGIDLFTIFESDDMDFVLDKIQNYISGNYIMDKLEINNRFSIHNKIIGYNLSSVSKPKLVGSGVYKIWDCGVSVYIKEQ